MYNDRLKSLGLIWERERVVTTSVMLFRSIDIMIDIIILTIHIDVDTVLYQELVEFSPKVVIPARKSATTVCSDGDGGRR